MFEHIHFQEITFHKPSTSQAAERQLEKHGLLKDSLRIGDFYKKHKDEIEFSLEGTSKSLFPPPCSTMAKEQLLYMQVFGLLDAGPHYFTRRKNYPSYLLLYTYAGKGKLEYMGKEHILEKGHGFLIDCRQEHTYQTWTNHEISTKDARWEISMLHFNGHPAELLFQTFFQDGSPIFCASKSSSYQQNMENALLACQNASSFQEFDISLLLNKLLLDIIKEKYKDSQTIPDHILYLKKYLEHHFETSLSLDELSEFTNVSKYHLAREFKKYTGFSINEYLIELRLNRAKFLLTNTPLPPGQICQMCGFGNYSNFYKLFCKHTKVSPNQYRNGAG